MRPTAATAAATTNGYTSLALFGIPRVAVNVQFRLGEKKTDEPEGASSLLYYIPLLREPPDELMDRFSFYPEIQEFDAFGWPRVEKADQI